MILDRGMAVLYTIGAVFGKLKKWALITADWVVRGGTALLIAGGLAGGIFEYFMHRELASDLASSNRFRKNSYLSCNQPELFVTLNCDA